MPFELIIAQCKKLQPKGQMAFYRLFYEQVFQRCYALLKDAEHAEEIMQDTLLKMLQNMNSFKGNETSMQKLLNTIAINKSIDVLRKKKKIIFEEVDTLPESPVEEREDDEKMIEIAQKHLETLPTGYRMVILLRIFEELPFEKIGKKLNISPSTARSQFARGVKKLQYAVSGEKVKEDIFLKNCNL